MSDRNIPLGFMPTDLVDGWENVGNMLGCHCLIYKVERAEYCPNTSCGNCILNGGNPNRISEIKNYLTNLKQEDNVPDALSSSIDRLEKAIRDLESASINAFLADNKEKPAVELMIRKTINALQEEIIKALKEKQACQ